MRQIFQYGFNCLPKISASTKHIKVQEGFSIKPVRHFTPCHVTSTAASYELRPSILSDTMPFAA